MSLSGKLLLSTIFFIILFLMAAVLIWPPNEYIITKKNTIAKNVSHISFTDDNIIVFQNNNKEIMEIDDTKLLYNMKKLTSPITDAQDMEFSPNGQYVAIQEHKSNYILDLETHETTPVSPYAKSITWSKNGSHVYYQDIIDEHHASSIEELNIQTKSTSTLANIDLSDYLESSGRVFLNIAQTGEIIYALEPTDASPPTWWTLTTTNTPQTREAVGPIGQFEVIEYSPDSQYLLAAVNNPETDDDVWYYAIFDNTIKRTALTKMNKGNAHCTWSDNEYLICLIQESQKQGIWFVNPTTDRYYFHSEIFNVDISNIVGIRKMKNKLYIIEEKGDGTQEVSYFSL